MRRLRELLLASVASVLIAISLWMLAGQEQGVTITPTRVEGTPVTVYRPPTAEPAPVVLISHGFAGSQQLMQAFALSLARSGYLAVTFDYLGHGRHPQPLSGDITRIEGATMRLVEQTGVVAEYALTLDGASGELALLGHSMASDIIVRYANQNRRVRATVAVSMFSEAVSPSSPRNLLMLVGGFEQFLRDASLDVLAQVTNTPREGHTVVYDNGANRRRLAVIDGVEHVGVLYAADSLTEAVRWLNDVFERDSNDTAAGRGLAIALLLLGLACGAYPVAQMLPVVTQSHRGAALPWRRLGLAGLAPALLTPVLLAAFPADFMGTLVGGYLAMHFFVYGVLTALILIAMKQHAEVRLPSRRDLQRFASATVPATLYLAGAFAWALDSYVTSYAITSVRTPLLLVTLIGTLSYFLSDEWMVHGAGAARGGHLFTRACFLLSLAIAVALSFEDLFFLLIIGAVIVIYFLIYGLFSRWVYLRTGHPAVPAIANAVTFAWALAAVFPFIEK